MEERRASYLYKLQSGMGFVLAVWLTAKFMASQGSLEQAVLVAAGIILALIAFMRPVMGLGLYLLLYPMVPAGETISPLKVATLALTVLLLMNWAMQQSIKREKFISKPEYKWLFAFIAFLCISPLIGMFNNFTPSDWARDIAPMLNLLMVPVMVDHFRGKKNRWLLYLFFIPVSIGIVRDIVSLLSLNGFPMIGLGALQSLPVGSFHPSLGFGLGIIMYLHKAPHRLFWLALSFVCMGAALLSPTRTVWITMGTMTLLIVLLSYQRKAYVIVAVSVLLAIAGYMLLFAVSSGYVEAQQTRFEGLVNYSEDLSVESRMDEMNQAADLFASSPFLGVGFGYQYHFWRHWVEEGGAGQMVTNFTHNDIMFIASKGGIIGLILFFLMLFKLVVALTKRRQESPNSIQAAWATLGILAILNSIIIGLSTPCFQTRQYMLGYVVLLSMGLAYRNNTEDENS